jgi:hypothetical protein
VNSCDENSRCGSSIGKSARFAPRGGGRGKNPTGAEEESRGENCANERRCQKVNWSDTWSRADAIIGEKPAPGKPGSQIVRGATMRVYFDPSFLVALYLPEALSAQAPAVVDRQAQTSCSRDLASFLEIVRCDKCDLTDWREALRMKALIMRANEIELDERMRSAVRHDTVTQL